MKADFKELYKAVKINFDWSELLPSYQYGLLENVINLVIKTNKILIDKRLCPNCGEDIWYNDEYANPHYECHHCNSKWTFDGLPLGLKE